MIIPPILEERFLTGGLQDKFDNKLVYQNNYKCT